MSVNVAAPMRIVRRLGPAMCDKGEGVIINIGDVEVSLSAPLSCQSKQKTANQPTNQPLTDDDRNEKCRASTPGPATPPTLRAPT